MEAARMTPRSLLVATTLAVLAALAAVVGGCATAHYIPGTTVEDTKVNQEILQVCDQYRQAMEERDAQKLITLASPHYYEDSGTPIGADDYGYEGLKLVLQTRLAVVRTLRYDIQYRGISVSGNRAHVDIRYDASFQMATAMGDRWEHKRSDKRMVLERANGRWTFLAGM
jgi:hypothetical protein